MRSKIVLSLQELLPALPPIWHHNVFGQIWQYVLRAGKAGPWQAQQYKPLKQPRTDSHTSSRGFPSIVRLWDLPSRTKNQAERLEAIRDGSGTMSRHIRPNWSVL